MVGKPELIIILLAVLFFCGGPLIAFAIARKRQRTLAWFREHGERITATVTYVYRARQFYQVAAKWDDPQTHKPYYFQSNGLPFKPAYSSGDTVPVSIDPANPHHYLLLLDPLEEKRRSA